MPFKEYFETDEHFLLSFEPALSEEQLSELPHPYWGKPKFSVARDCSDVPSAGWPVAAVVQTDLGPNPLIALDKHSLRLAAVIDMNTDERRQILDTIENIEYFALRDYLGKLAKTSQQSRGEVAR